MNVLNPSSAVGIESEDFNLIIVTRVISGIFAGGLFGGEKMVSVIFWQVSM